MHRTHSSVFCLPLLLKRGSVKLPLSHLKDILEHRATKHTPAIIRFARGTCGGAVQMAGWIDHASGGPRHDQKHGPCNSKRLLDTASLAWDWLIIHQPLWAGHQRAGVPGTVGGRIWHTPQARKDRQARDIPDTAVVACACAQFSRQHPQSVMLEGAFQGARTLIRLAASVRPGRKPALAKSHLHATHS
jgi:hypothetical protein